MLLSQIFLGYKYQAGQLSSHGFFWLTGSYPNFSYSHGAVVVTNMIL